jgi:hypothetical protein
MASDALKREAVRAWLEYEEALVRAFRFSSGSKMAADGLQQFLSKADDEQLKAFTVYRRKQAEEVRSMKFLGEK